MKLLFLLFMFVSTSFGWCRKSRDIEPIPTVMVPCKFYSSNPQSAQRGIFFTVDGSLAGQLLYHAAFNPDCATMLPFAERSLDPGGKYVVVYYDPSNPVDRHTVEITVPRTWSQCVWFDIP